MPTSCAEHCAPLGDVVDAVVVYEDMAGQTRPLVSPELYRKRIKPFHAALVEVIRSESAARAVLHCDGAVADLLPDFVEIGIEAVNPVQTSALGMEPPHLKRAFGRNLCFWGGFDAAWALAFGRPQDVAVEATRALDALAPGGGYVFAPVVSDRGEHPARERARARRDRTGLPRPQSVATCLAQLCHLCNGGRIAGALCVS